MLGSLSTIRDGCKFKLAAVWCIKSLFCALSGFLFLICIYNIYEKYIRYIFWILY